METQCETLARLREQAQVSGNEALAAALDTAFAAAGCGVTAESGGTGRPPPPEVGP